MHIIYDMNERQLTEQLGEVIRALRKAKGLSQEEFAHLCGIHRTYVGAVERGEKSMTVVTASKFADALDMALSQLFIEVEKRA